MFEKEKIEALTQKKLKAFEGFLVDVIIAPTNKILVEIDSPRGVSVNECADVNRFLNAELDNETNAFELTVSSPGLEKPFKVFEQYQKNIGRQVKVKTIDKKEHQGTLLDVDTNKITLKQRIKEAPEGKTKKEWVEKAVTIAMETIKETKVVIIFN